MANATVAVDAHDDHGHHETNTGISNNKLAMWLFLASDCLLFGALRAVYLTQSRQKHCCTRHKWCSRRAKPAHTRARPPPVAPDLRRGGRHLGRARSGFPPRWRSLPTTTTGKRAHTHEPRGNTHELILPAWIDHS